MMDKQWKDESKPTFFYGDEYAAEDKDECPNCGSNDFVLIGFGTTPVRTHVYILQCRECQHQWTSD